MKSSKYAHVFFKLELLLFGAIIPYHILLELISESHITLTLIVFGLLFCGISTLVIWLHNKFKRVQFRGGRIYIFEKRKKAIYDWKEVKSLYYYKNPFIFPAMYILKIKQKKGFYIFFSPYTFLSFDPFNDDSYLGQYLYKMRAKHNLL